MGLYRGWLMVGVVTALSVLSFPAFGLAVAQWVQLGFVLPPPVGFGWTQTQAGTLFGSATRFPPSFVRLVWYTRFPSSSSPVHSPSSAT